jgi:O-antigen/teichoic acid export membrane protein
MTPAIVAQLAPLLGLDSSEDGLRRRRRYMRAALTSASTILTRGVTALTLLVSVPLTARYLGSERYGIWLALSSLIAIIAHVDLGLSSGLVNAISAADGHGDNSEAAHAVSSVFLMLSAMAVGFTAALLLIAPYLPLGRLAHVSSPAAGAEVGPALCALLIIFFLSMPLGIGMRVQIGYQEGYKANLWQSAGCLLGLAALLVAVRAKANLPWLVVATTATPLLASAANCVQQFWIARPALRPRWSNFRWQTARQILRSGLLFCLAGLAAILTTQIPYLMITRILGPSPVAQYGVSQKMLTLLPMIAAIATFPLWPAYREALASGDRHWIARTFRLTAIVTAAISLVGAIAFLLSYRMVIPWWVDQQVVPDRSTALALSILVVATSLKWTTWMCLNGCNRLRGQATYPFPIVMAAAVAASLAWHRYGLAGIVWPFAIGECLVLVAEAADLYLGLRGMSATGACLAESSS